MATPKNKAELLGEIKSSYQRMIVDFQKVPSQFYKEKCMPGHAKGTVMSPSNLAAYLLGWASLVMKWVDKKAKEEKVDFPETGFSWNQLGDLAQKFYADYDNLSLSQTLNALEKKKNEIVELINSKGNKELYWDTTFYSKYSLGRMIQLNTSSPYKNARTRIRVFLKELQSQE